VNEGAITADEDGLIRLVTRLGPEIRGCIMSGAPWVRDSLAECGWTIQIADARGTDGVALAMSAGSFATRRRRAVPAQAPTATAPV
jgi:hypothetical protein